MSSSAKNKEDPWGLLGTDQERHEDQRPNVTFWTQKRPSDSLNFIFISQRFFLGKKERLGQTTKTLWSKQPGIQPHALTLAIHFSWKFPIRTLLSNSPVAPCLDILFLALAHTYPYLNRYTIGRTNLSIAFFLPTLCCYWERKDLSLYTRNGFLRFSTRSKVEFCWAFETFSREEGYHSHLTGDSRLFVSYAGTLS